MNYICSRGGHGTNIWYYYEGERLCQNCWNEILEAEKKAKMRAKREFSTLRSKGRDLTGNK